MKSISWLLKLASEKPLIFSVALLLFGIAYLAVDNKNLKVQLNSCQNTNTTVHLECERRIDSVSFHYRAEQYELNKEMRETLNEIIFNYKDQLKEQKNVNNNVTSSINKAAKVLKENDNKLKNIDK